MGLMMGQMRHSRCSVPRHSSPASLQHPILTPTPTATTTGPANQGKPALVLSPVLDSLYREFAAAAVAVAVTLRLPGHPCPALRCSALLCAALPRESISLLPHSAAVSVFAAARRPSSRGFPGRGCDGTCHGTVRPGPVDVPRAAGVPRVPGYPVQRGWGPRSKSTQVPERHGYPRSTQLPAVCGMGEAPRACTRYTHSTVAAASAKASSFPC